MASSIENGLCAIIPCIKHIPQSWYDSHHLTGFILLMWQCLLTTEDAIQHLAWGTLRDCELLSCSRHIFL